MCVCVCVACVTYTAIEWIWVGDYKFHITVGQDVLQNLISNRGSALHISESHLENDAMATIIITMCDQLALGRRKRPVCWWLLNVSFEPP